MLRPPPPVAGVPGVASRPRGPSDGEIIARSLDDPALFGEIYARHHRTIQRYLARRAGHHAAADLAAETFARAFATRDRFWAGAPSARPWLHGIAANLLRQHFRSLVRGTAAQARWAGIGGPPVDHAARAAERVDAARRVHELEDGLAALPARELEVLRARIDLDLSYQEIADRLGLPVGTVRSRLARARARIQRRAAQPSCTFGEEARKG